MMVVYLEVYETVTVARTGWGIKVVIQMLFAACYLIIPPVSIYQTVIMSI